MVPSPKAVAFSSIAWVTCPKAEELLPAIITSFPFTAPFAAANDAIAASAAARVFAYFILTLLVLPRMKNDIVDVFEACIDGTLDQMDLQFADNAAVCVVLASGGYPVSYRKGYPIQGLDAFPGNDGTYCFHAGTAFDSEGRIVTNGGRVLDVVALGDNLKAARAKAYEAVKRISFRDQYMRTDIGHAIDEA